MRLRHKKWTNSVLQENEDIILKKEDIAEIKSTDLLEIGSGKVLSGMVARTTPNIKAYSINSIETLKEFLNR